MKTKKTQPKQRFRNDSGVGYDEKAKRYYTIVYIWEYVVDGLKKTLPYIDYKPGITGIGILEATIVNKRHAVYPLNPIWSDRYYLPIGITKDQAKAIVKKMDDDFKTEMIKFGFDKRRVLNTTSIGTEPVRIPKKLGINYLKNQWKEKFENAVRYYHKIVTLHSVGMDYKNYKVPAVFADVFEDINEQHKNGLDRFRQAMIEGFGKTCILYLAGYVSDFGRECKIKINITNNIPNTRNKAKEIHELWDNGYSRKIVVCSNENPVKTERGDILSYSNTNGDLKQIIHQTLLMDYELDIYINRDSTLGFYRDVLLPLIDTTKYNRPIFEGLDEIQYLTGDKDNKVLGFIKYPLPNVKRYSVTATEKRRNSKDSTTIIKNDDLEIFGPLTFEVNHFDAVKRQRQAPLQFIQILWKANDTFTKAIFENELIKLYIQKSPQNVRGKLINALVAIMEGIKENEYGIGIGAWFTTDCDDLVELCEIAQKEGLIPSKYKIINGRRNNSLLAQTEANLRGEEYPNKPFIFVGTSYMCVGLNIPSLTFGYSMVDLEEIWMASQFKGRFGRWLHWKKMATLCIVQKMDDTTINTFLKLKTILQNGQLAHSNTSTKLKKVKTNKGSKQKNIGLKVKKSNLGIGENPVLDAWWDKVMNQVERGETELITYKDYTKDYWINVIGKYKTFKSFYTKEKELFQSSWIDINQKQKMTREEYDKLFCDNFSDYKKLPNSESKLDKIVEMKYPFTGKAPKPEVLWMFRVKSAYCFEYNYA
jgi:hypothetical protein